MQFFLKQLIRKKNLLKNNILITISLAVITASSSQADILSAWDISGIELDAAPFGSSPYTFSATTLDSNVNSSALSLSSTVNPSTSASQYGFKVSGGSETASLASAITAGHFLEFSITAASGFVLNLTSIEILGASSGTGADDVAILSSVAGYSSGNELASLTGIAGVTGGFDTDTSGFGSAINISSSAYQEITSATFRIYGWNTSAGAGVTNIRNLSGNDLVINGTTAAAPVPEPSSYALLVGMLTLGFVASRRRSLRQ